MEITGPLLDSEQAACSDLEVGTRQVQDATTAPEKQVPSDPASTKYRYRPLH
jgi:hypothetical protein